MKAERRHELKTNVLYARLTQAAGWAEEHKGLLFVGALVALGVFSIAYLWIHQRLARPREAWALLARTSVQEEQFKRLVEDYGGTRAAAEGRLIWAGLLYEERRHQEAREQLERALADADDDHYLAARALVELATMAEQERKVEEALRLYRRLVEEYPAPGYAELARERTAALERPGRPTAPPAAFAPLVRTRPASRPGVEVEVPVPPPAGSAGRNED